MIQVWTSKISSSSCCPRGPNSRRGQTVTPRLKALRRVNRTDAGTDGARRDELGTGPRVAGLGVKVSGAALIRIEDAQRVVRVDCAVVGPNGQRRRRRRRCRSLG